MNNESISLTYKQLGTIALVLINLLIIGPGGWVLNTIWNHAETFKTETEQQFDDLDKRLKELNIKVSSDYVTKKSFSQYRKQMGVTLRHLDSKLNNEHQNHRNHDG